MALQGQRAGTAAVGSCNEPQEGLRAGFSLTYGPGKRRPGRHLERASYHCAQRLDEGTHLNQRSALIWADTIHIYGILWCEWAHI